MAQLRRPAMRWARNRLMRAARPWLQFAPLRVKTTLNLFNRRDQRGDMGISNAKRSRLC